MHDKADATRGVGATDQSSRPPANPVWCGPQLHAYDDVAVAVLPQAEVADTLLGQLQQAGVAADQVGLAVTSESLMRSSGLLACSTPEQDLFDTLVELSVPSAAARLYQQSFNARQAILAVRGAVSRPDLVGLLASGTGSAPPDRPIDAQAVERQAADRPPGPEPEPATQAAPARHSATRR
jgi:hypothetical protein